MKIARKLQTDVLIVGAGSAGLRAALSAAECGSKVILTNKGPLARSGISLAAAGGIQARFHPDDSEEEYFHDVVTCGYGLGDQNLISTLAHDAHDRVLDLERYGVRLVRDSQDRYAVRQFPGQSKPRSLLIKGGGIGLVSALAKACRHQANINIIDEFFVTGLLTGKTPATAVTGALGINLRTGELTHIEAKAVILATGGCQWLWEINDCPADAVGDGIIHAYRAGAELVDMEMVLFYPSVIVWPPSVKGAFVHYEFFDPAILDGNVYDRTGVPVLPKPLPVRDEAMRIMAKAIHAGQGGDHNGLFWYVGNSPKGAEAVRRTLNTLQYNYIKLHGIDPAVDKIEVAPGAHYLMGGIYIDEVCRTGVKGLFATPECAGNFDGANRLAGNGLTGTQVFGARAGISAHQWAQEAGHCEANADVLEKEWERVAGIFAHGSSGQSRVMQLRARLRADVQLYAGVRRDAAGLQRLIQSAGEVQEELKKEKIPAETIFNQQLVEVLQLDIMCDAVKLIAGSALMRQESRGHHFRTDFPVQDDEGWLQHIITFQGEYDSKFETRPVKQIF